MKYLTIAKDSSFAVVITTCPVPGSVETFLQTVPIFG